MNFPNTCFSLEARDLSDEVNHLIALHNEQERMIRYEAFGL